MNLLRVLALLGKNDQASSEGMYEVLVDVMKRADTGINIGYAIGECFALSILFLVYIISRTHLHSPLCTTISSTYKCLMAIKYESAMHFAHISELLEWTLY